MSWNGNAENEMDIRLKGWLEVQFTCPRCEKTQTQLIHIEGENNSTAELSCRNTLCGGSDTVRLDLLCSVSGSYKGLSDNPLKRD